MTHGLHDHQLHSLSSDEPSDVEGKEPIKFVGDYLHIRSRRRAIPDLRSNALNSFLDGATQGWHGAYDRSERYA
jgi:hypothetical protein